MQVPTRNDKAGGCWVASHGHPSTSMHLQQPVQIRQIIHKNADSQEILEEEFLDDFGLVYPSPYVPPLLIGDGHS